MSDIEELHSRIMAAMDRVARGVETLGDAGGDEVEALKQELADEQTANAQLNERVKALGERQAETEAKASEANARIQTFDLELQRLRQANQQLSDSCEALRRANAEGVGDAELINAAMTAEITALKAARSAEIAEMNEIIAALTPLLDADGAQSEGAL